MHRLDRDRTAARIAFRPRRIADGCRVDPPVGTGACARAAGDAWLDFKADGKARRALLHVPLAVAGGRLPAIVALHGYSSKAEDFARYSGLSGKADASGFLVVYPQALGNTPEWQLTGVMSEYPENRASDREFIGQIVDWLSASGCVDATRIFLTGHSQGGGMSADMSCELAGRVAGVGVVSGVALRPLCDPSRPVPVVFFHAVDDPVLPYAGGPVQGAPGAYPHQRPVESVVSEWAVRNGCAIDRADVTLGDGTQQSDWQGCVAPVRFFRLPRGGHDWAPTTDDRLWDFFSSLPGLSL